MVQPVYSYWWRKSNAPQLCYPWRHPCAALSWMYYKVLIIHPWALCWSKESSVNWRVCHVLTFTVGEAPTVYTDGTAVSFRAREQAKPVECPIKFVKQSSVKCLSQILVLSKTPVSSKWIKSSQRARIPGDFGNRNNVLGGEHPNTHLDTMLAKLS